MACGLYDIVNFLIVECSRDVNARGFDGDKAALGVTMHVTSREGHSDVAQVLLEEGAMALCHPPFREHVDVLLHISFNIHSKGLKSMYYRIIPRDESFVRRCKD